MIQIPDPSRDPAEFMCDVQENPNGPGATITFEQFGYMLTSGHQESTEEALFKIAKLAWDMWMISEGEPIDES